MPSKTIVPEQNGSCSLVGQMGAASVWIATWGVEQSTSRALESRWQEQINKALDGAV